MPASVLSPRRIAKRLIVRPACYGAAAIALLVAGAASGQDTGIFVMRLDGTEERKVVQVDGFASHGCPRWSHDGKRLAFDAFEGPNDVRKVYVVNLDGSGLAEISDRVSAADWSPDDKQLVFFSEDGDGGTVFVQNVDGQGRDQLTSGYWPRWSPDGGKIALCDMQCVKLLDLATGEERLLVNDAFDQRPGAFEWSHDGKRLAFVSRRQANGPRELFIVDIDATNQELKPRHAHNGNFGGHVSWSPDDKQLAVTIESFIHTIDVEGTDPPKRLAGQPDKSRDPSWSGDGKWIAFARRAR